MNAERKQKDTGCALALFSPIVASISAYGFFAAWVRLTGEEPTAVIFWSVFLVNGIAVTMGSAAAGLLVPGVLPDRILRALGYAMAGGFAYLILPK